MVETNRNWKSIDDHVNAWLWLRERSGKSVQQLEAEIATINEENKLLIRKLVRNPSREALIGETIDENTKRLDRLADELSECKRKLDNADADKARYINSMNMMRSILESHEISNANLVLLIDTILVSQKCANRRFVSCLEAQGRV